MLDRIIGRSEVFFSLGEMFSIWELNVIKNQLCGCGESFKECEVWRRIFKDAFGGYEAIDAERMSQIWKQSMRVRHLPFVRMGGRRSEKIRQLSYYLENLEKLYKSIKDNTSARVIVDSSKLPTYANLLRMIPSVDLYVVHLVRDPRGVAFSWQRAKKEPSGGSQEEIMERLNPKATALAWSIQNLACEGFLWKLKGIPSVRIRYEEFVRDPQMALHRILNMMDERVDAPEIFTGSDLKLRINHTLAGNPNRFQVGAIRLKEDDDWKREMDLKDRLQVTTRTWPLLKRYGYSN